MSVLLLLRSGKEALDIVDLRQVPIPEADPTILASDVVARVSLTWLLKKEEVKKKSCSRVTPRQVMLHQTPRLMPLAMPPTMQPMLLTSRATLHQIQDIMQELSLL
jgi:hypothetical protein